MSNIQVCSKLNTITTVTVVLFSAIAAAVLLQLSIVPFILTVPVFLIPLAVYMTVLGLNSRKQPYMTQDYSYYLAWGAITLTISMEWILLDEKMDIVLGVITGLAIALGYVYLNRFKSRMIQV